MIPDIELLDQPLNNEQQPSLTWKLDVAKGRIVGMIDGLEAVRQSVYKILQTNRFWHAIYSFDYGHELNIVIGSSPEVVESEVKRIINEALLQDDRIISITYDEISVNGEIIEVKLTVNTNYGDFQMEVSRDV